METLKELVRSLALLVLVAAFVEMLLPNQKMKGYVQLILGLFLIVAVLTPVTRFLGQGESLAPLAWEPDGPKESLKTILDQGRGLAGRGQDRLQEENRARLGKQMEALVRLIPGVEAAAVDVVMEGDAIKEVRVTAKEGTPSADEVQIGDKPALVRAVEGVQARQEIVETLVNFYGLAPEQIHVAQGGGVNQ